MTMLHRAIFYSVVERYGSVAVFILSTAVLSRLLSPAEFGVYAVVNVFIAIVAASFQEIGGANYLIQKRHLSERDVRACFTMIFSLSLAVLVLILSLKGEIGRLLRNNAVESGIGVAALTFVISPISATLSALFRRDMNFRVLAICGLFGSVTAAVVSISLALVGYSYMAPIWGVVSGNSVAAAVLLAKYRNVRIFFPAFSGFREILTFGFYSSSISIVNVLCSLGPQIFIARILDFNAVGLYNRSINTTQVFDKLVVSSLNPVIMPAVVQRADTEGNLKRVYLDALKLLSVAQWPFLIFVSVMAPPIIVTWLGPAWIDTIPLIRLMSIAYLAMFGACLTYPVLVAAGRIPDALSSSVIALPLSMVVTLAAAFFGVKALAASALLTLPFQAGVSIYFVCKCLKIGFRELVIALRQSAIVAALATFGMVVSECLIEFHYLSPLPGLFFAAVLAFSGWVWGLRLTAHPLLNRLIVAADELPFRMPKVLFQTLGGGSVSAR